MKYESDYKFGQSIYLKADEEQKEYSLNRIILSPKGVVFLELFDVAMGGCFEVWEFLTSKEVDIMKKTGSDKKDEDEDDSP